MSKKKQLFVLVVDSDRTVAAALASVVRSGGFMAGTTSSHATALRIATRVVIDAAVIDVEPSDPRYIETAVELHRRYPDCGILLICNQVQSAEARFLKEEYGIPCDILSRPLSRAELLEKLESTRNPHAGGGPALQAA